MLDHGNMVHAAYMQIVGDIENDNLSKYPACTAQIWHKYRATLPSLETIRLYHVYHDCGKHLSLTIDNEGRRHYPNHAEHSYQLFSKYNDDVVAATLIKHDMHLHILRGEELCQFLKSFDYIGILWLTASAELHANAEMFGGYDQTSFKIKLKQIEKAGKRLLST